jgi:hypothetical protein
VPPLQLPEDQAEFTIQQYTEAISELMPFEISVSFDSGMGVRWMTLTLRSAKEGALSAYAVGQQLPLRGCLLQQQAIILYPQRARRGARPAVRSCTMSGRQGQADQQGTSAGKTNEYVGSKGYQRGKTSMWFFV